MTLRAGSIRRPLLAALALALLVPAAPRAGEDGVSAGASTATESLVAARAALLRSPPGERPAAFRPLDTGPIPGDAAPRAISVDVSGVRELRLVTTVVEGIANCNIWGEPRLIAADGSETRLGSLEPSAVTVGWGKLLLDRNWEGHPLRVGDRTFEHGIWVHADSEVRYALDGKYERFEAWVGEDRDRPGGRVRFRVLSGDACELPPAWASIARDFPEESGWLLSDAGGEAGAALWFSKRPDPSLEREMVGAALGPTVPGRAAILGEERSLVEAAAPAGDPRWLDLHARARRLREAAAIVASLPAGWERSSIEASLESLAGEGAAIGDPRWAAARARAIHAGEIARQHVALRHDLARRDAFARVAAETFRPEALILPSDRDPTDVVLRRTEALLADLLRTAAAPRLADAATALRALRATADATPVEDGERRLSLHGEACALRRRIALSNPLLDFDRILFVKRHRALIDHMCDQFYAMAARPGGGIFILEDAFGPDPRARDLLAGSVVERGRLAGRSLANGPPRRWGISFDGMGNLSGEETEGGAFVSPDLSPDGSSVLFAYAECAGDRRHRHHTDASRGHWDEGRCFHVFKVRIDGTGLEQLTDGTWNDFDPCWLPNGRIAFISERRGGYLRCGRVCPLYNLHDMAADGSGINCLSFHESNEWQPSVAHDGRIIYTRWDYVDRHGCTAHVPWITTPDGRDSRALHGNFAPRPVRPDMELDVRPVPGSPRYVATAAPHHGQAFGSLVLVDPGVPDDDAMGPLRRLTPDVGFPETQGGAEAYGTAWPLSEDYHLCAYDIARAAPGAGRPGDGDYGLYLVDAFGNKELIYRDADIGCMSPIPVRPRPVPPALVAAGTPEAAPGQGGEGTLAVINVYDSIVGWPAGARVKELRVLQVLPMSVPSGGPPHETGRRIAEAGDSVVPARWVLGTVPVEADGSAHFKVPAHRSLFFQALDEDGLAIQSMRSATYVRDGETLTCRGCHEPKNEAPPPAAYPLALRREPSAIRPDVDGSSPFSYPRLVQPVLDRRCVPCHERDPETPNLGREPIANRWYASYGSLVGFAFTSYGDGYRTIPGRFGARASKLHSMLVEGHHGLELSAEDLHRIDLWLDCSSMFYGVYEREAGEAQLRGEIARPSLE